MKKTYLQSLLTSIILATAFVTNAQIIVDNNIGTNADYSDLQEAITAAADNSTIYLHPSATSYGNIKIEKPITIIGRSHSEPSYSSSIGNLEITHNGSGTSLKGINFFQIDLNGLDGSSSGTVITAPILVQNVAFEQCHFFELKLNGLRHYYRHTNGQILSRTGIGSNNVLVRGGVFGNISHGYTSNLNISQNIITTYVGIQRPDSTILTNNIFLYDSSPVGNSGSDIGKVLIQNSIFIVNNGNPEELEIGNSQLDNCLAYNFGAGTYNIGASTNMIANNMLINTNPMFESLDISNTNLFHIDNNYKLATGSPAIGTGLNNEDMGVFGNGFTFTTVGNPVGFPTVNIVTSTAAVPENGILNVTISAKAN